MITITNNIRDFFEKDQEIPIVIYGAGNAGYWVGYYMNRCNRDFVYYIDKNVPYNDTLYNQKPIYLPEKLKDNSGRSIKIVVTPKDYPSVLSDLLWMDHLYGVNALCLVPRYKSIASHQDEYAINKLLAYFRQKLYHGDTPTIICNTCAAGVIYQMMGMLLLSPTINTGMESDHFLRFCKNLRYYMNIEMKELKRKRRVCNPTIIDDCPVGTIGDVEIWFGHSKSDAESLENWNRMRKLINWDRIIYLFVEQKRNTALPYAAISDFRKIPEPKLFVSQITARNIDGLNAIYMTENHFSNMGSAIENYFDLLGWMNECNSTLSNRK